MTRKPRSDEDDTPREPVASKRKEEAFAFANTVYASGEVFRPKIGETPLPVLRVIGREDYVIGGEYARGGLGQIFEAVDVRLGRPVAIKQLIEWKPHLVARFVHEALVTARLQHPAIVPVYEAGRWPTGEPFYAMKLVEGRSLLDLLSKHSTLAERLALLPNIIAVADALAYAHSKGVIHRDIKPSNVLIGSFGETVVIDWGLAKDLTLQEEVPAPEGEDSTSGGPLSSELTVVGAVMGTPAYMSPEQAGGQRVDARTDVYALGALLYHVLVGEPPYTGEDVLRQVLAAPPPPPEERIKGVPRELAAIVRKAMARRSKDRYPSAKELAEDLRRFQTGQMVSAHEYSRLTLTLRWLRRYRWPVAVVMLSLGVWFAAEARRYRQVVQERDRAEAQRVVAERRASELILVEAHAALERDPTAALVWLKKYPLGGEAWATVHDLAVEAHERGVARHILLRDRPLPAFGDFSRDGRRFVSAGAERTVRVWDTASARVLAEGPRSHIVEYARFLDDDRTVLLVSWGNREVSLWDPSAGTIRPLGRLSAPQEKLNLSRRLRRMAVPEGDGTIQLWDLASGQVRSLRGHQGPVTDVSLTEGGQLASVGTDGTVRTWSLASGTSRILNARLPSATHVGYSASGRYVAAGTATGQVWLWDEQGGSSRIILRGDGLLRVLLFSPDERWLAASHVDGSIRVYELPANREQHLRGHLGPVVSLDFSQDEPELASGGHDGTVRLWRLDTGEMAVLRGHASEVAQVLYAPGGRLLASMANDRTIRLWQLGDGESRVLQAHGDRVETVSFSPDGRYLATGGFDKTIRLWQPEGLAGPVLRGHDDLVWKLVFSPDGRSLVSASFDGTVRLWDVAGGTGRILGKHGGTVWDVTFADAGRTVISAGADGAVRSWVPGEGRGAPLSEPGVDLRTIALSPDGRLLAWEGPGHEVRIHERSTGREQGLPGHEDLISRMAFTPDGRFLFSAGWDGAVWRWDPARTTGQRHHAHQAPVRALAIAPDGQLLASGGEDQLVMLTPVGGGETRTFAGHHDVIRQVAFSPDGRLLLSASWDHTVRVWELASGALLKVLHHQGHVVDLAFSPDGKLLASASADNLVRLWTFERGARLPASPAALQRWLLAATTAVLDERGRIFSPSER